MCSYGASNMKGTNINIKKIMSARPGSSNWPKFCSPTCLPNANGIINLVQWFFKHRPHLPSPFTLTCPHYCTIDSFIPSYIKASTFCLLIIMLCLNCTTHTSKRARKKEKKDSFSFPSNHHNTLTFTHIIIFVLKKIACRN